MGRRTKKIRTAAYGGTAINFDILPEKYVMKRRINRNRIAAFGLPEDPSSVLAQDNIYRDTALSQASQVIDPITASVNQGLDLAGELLATLSGDQWAKGAVGGTSSKWYQANKSRFAPAAYGNPQQNIPIEVEGGETAQLPNGEMIGFNGASHEYGGIDVDLPEGTEIYSQRLTRNGQTLADRKVEREEKMKRATQKVRDRIKEDKLAQNTLERLQMINDYQEAQDTAFQNGVRDLVSQIYGEDSGVYPQANAACGGRVKAAYGDPPHPFIVKAFGVGSTEKFQEQLENRGNFNNDLINSFINNLSFEEAIRYYNPGSIAQIIDDESSYDKFAKNGTHVGPFQMDKNWFKTIYGKEGKEIYRQYINKTRTDEEIGQDMAKYLVELYRNYARPNEYYPIDYGQMKILQFKPKYYRTGIAKRSLKHDWNIKKDIEHGKLEDDIDYRDVGEVIDNYNKKYLNPNNAINVKVSTSDYPTDEKVKFSGGGIVHDLPEIKVSATNGIPVIPPARYYNDINPLSLEATFPKVPSWLDFQLDNSNNNNKSKSKTNWNNFLSSATLGNLNVLAGNMYQGIAPYLTTLKQREGDMPNVNTFKNYNKDAIRSIQDAMDASARTRDTQLADLELSRRNALNDARNQARSVNTLNALGAAMSDYYNQGTEKVYNAYQDNYNKLLAQLSGLQSDRDLKYMTAEDQRNERDTQDRDAFYRNLAKDNAEIGRAIAQSGKDLNAMRLAVYNSNLINQLSKYGIGIDRNGNLYELPKENQAYGGRVRRTSRIRKCK